MDRIASHDSLSHVVFHASFHASCLYLAQVRRSVSLVLDSSLELAVLFSWISHVTR